MGKIIKRMMAAFFAVALCMTAVPVMAAGQGVAGDTAAETAGQDVSAQIQATVSDAQISGGDPAAVDAASIAMEDIAQDGWDVGFIASSLLTGGQVAQRGNISYGTDASNDTLEATDADGNSTVIANGSFSNINAFDGAIWYTQGTAAYRLNLEDGSSAMVFDCGTQIAELAIINDSAAVYLAGGCVCLYSEDTGATTLYDDGDITGFIPTQYGIFIQKGDLFDRDVYVAGVLLFDGAYSWGLSSDSQEAVFSKDGQDYSISITEAFSGNATSDSVTPYEGAEVSAQDLVPQDSDECEVCEENAQHVDAAEVESDNTVTAMEEDGVVSAFDASGTNQQNIVLRARQQTDVQWTPLANITGWNGTYTFKAGTTYSGLPYSQAVYARYIPFASDNYTPSAEALNTFVTAVNDAGSKMYTSKSTYNKTAPYYGGDCSSFVSYAWGIGRSYTGAIGSNGVALADQSYNGYQIGDMVLKSGHVKLVTAVGYNSDGSISYIEISESTPPKTKVTRYGTGGTKTLDQLNSERVSGGYTVYRYKKINTSGAVSYTAVSVAASGSSQIADFVNGMYENILQRAADAGGYSNWVSGLSAHTTTAANCAVEFISGAEFNNKSLDIESYVTALYKALLGRSPGSGEVQIWASFMRDGYSKYWVLENIIGSGEFGTRCSNMGVSRGSYRSAFYTDSHIPVAGFVRGLYANMLGREPEDDGFVAWTSGLVNRTISATSAIRGFYDSSEFKSISLSASDYATRLYGAILERTPSAQETLMWATALNNGSVTRDSMLAEFLSSQEFANNCAGHGISV